MNNYATAPKTDWRSLYIASFISFCAAVQYGLYFSSLWPYLKIIDPDITEQFFGVIIAAYSMAACFSSPLFGYWSNRAKRVSVPMKAGIISMFTGNVIYLSCELLPSHRRYALCVARFLVGVGSANIPLLRAYASTSCHPKDRPRATAFVTGGIAIGIMIGPAIQACFTSISYPGLIIFRNFSISMYTASAYGACFMNALSFVCLQFFFVEKYSGIHKENAQQTDERTVPKFDRLAAFICNFTRFTQQFTFTNVEILGAPYAMTVFAFTKYDTVQYGSLAQSGMGIMGVSFFVLFIAFKLNKYVKYRIGNITAFGLMLLFHLATYPWPFLQTKIETYTDNDFLNTTEEIVGCNTDHFGWCTTTPRVNPWVYYISFMVFRNMTAADYNVVDPKTEWKSIYIASFILFCSAVQYGLYFSSLWPYLETIDPDATEQFFALIIASYSIATCISSPLAGYWSNKIKQVRLPLTAGLCCMLAGNVLYLSCELLPSHRRYALFVARFLTGFGSANTPLLRAYASTACNPKDRARAMSFVTAGVAVGVMTGPAFQLLFTPISYPGLVIFPNFSVSMYTASAYGACMMNALGLICVRCFFVEKYSGLHKENVNDGHAAEVPKFDKLAAVICNITRFAQQFVETSIELIGSPFAMAVFAFSKQNTIQYGSLAQSGMGIAGITVFVAFIGCRLNKRVKYRIGSITSLFLLLAFYLFTYSWPFLPGQLVTHTDRDVMNSTQELVGCNVDKVDWCYSMKPVNPWLYYVSFMMFVGVGYPATDICLSTVYGRVLGPRRQGTMQGIFNFSSGLSRILSPLSVSVFYDSYGPKVIWYQAIFILSATIILWIAFYDRMVALNVCPSVKTLDDDLMEMKDVSKAVDL
ncbi:hypothetical protein QR680_010064 [Steinernema hermaphroditum]|uniref:Major facilitator superfamily (MFS) profile domain-containing protein n=1 Tax=Steinernema hermaphroditum TaxID=289476 RepID=A0AA39IPI0_9BILA|nr:hypothetical protein QR680_010064 [Steinernema hermaphroditum]